ncbi:MAG: STAS domain-containing protein [Candidatus Muirbacterium halophilum]|nr:STAS domain-containing protein [Candidatus Muirbacterium halophilum]MCK9476279.1 STAS domain-containing protein [Candidatus Muirbacterium halophilum]
MIVNIDISQKENVLILKMPDEIVGDVVQEIFAIFEKIIKEKNNNIILDLSETLMLDSAGIGIIIKLEKEISLQNRKMVVANASKSVEKIMYMCRLNTILKMTSSIEKAMEIIE